MYKKAQSQIITTVLIILLVLAAVIIVWQVVQSTVQSGAAEAGSQADCLGLNLIVTGAAADATAGMVTVRREIGSNKVATVTGSIYIDGADSTTDFTAIGELESTASIDVGALTAGELVQVSVEMDGAKCPLVGNKVAA